MLAASAPAAVVSATGVGLALGRLRRTPPPTAFRRPLAWAVAVAVPATLACLALTANWTEHRALLNWLAPISVWVLVPLAAALAALRARGTRARLVAAAALTVAGLALVSIGTRPSTLWTGSRPVTTEAGVVLPSQGLTLNPAASPAVPPAATADWAQAYAWAAEAATWIDGNVPDDAVLATGDPVSALVPALTGRRMYIAGSIYQVGLGAADEIDDVIARSEASRRFAAVTDEAAARPLCEAGVRWAWLEVRAGRGRSRGRGGRPPQRRGDDRQADVAGVLLGAGTRRCATASTRFSNRCQDTKPTAHDTAVVIARMTSSSTRFAASDVVPPLGRPRPA